MTNELVKHMINDLGIDYSYKDEEIEAENKVRESHHEKFKGYRFTELGTLFKVSRGKYSGATLQLPTTNYHTVKEKASWKGVFDMMEVLEELCKMD